MAWEKMRHKTRRPGLARAFVCHVATRDASCLGGPVADPSSADRALFASRSATRGRS